MPKIYHEVRDPVHAFVRYMTKERLIIDSLPFQRLRHIHQLAMTSYLYPGATHKRFEHSLGVMELATRIYDVLTCEDSVRNLDDRVAESIPEILSKDDIGYWRQVVRAAALCHDLGHLPFSHAAEKELLPSGYTHETLTKQLILNENMNDVWRDQNFRAEHVAKIAVGPKEYDQIFSPWEALVSEIITGDVFGADRMDYLLRDSYHMGVAYGNFDHHRLIQTLRILPSPIVKNESEQSCEPQIGIEIGGLQAAESLLWARYLMFSQVYFHHVRRSYDKHLQKFMLSLFGENKYPTEWKEFLAIADSEICSEIRSAAYEHDHRGHTHACHIAFRNHYKKVYQRTARDFEKNPRAVQAVYTSLCDKFGVEFFLVDDYVKDVVPGDFPILVGGRDVVSAHQQSQAVRSLPPTVSGYVFVAPERREEVAFWLTKEKDGIINSGVCDG